MNAGDRRSRNFAALERGSAALISCGSSSSNDRCAAPRRRKHRRAYRSVFQTTPPNSPALNRISRTAARSRTSPPRCSIASRQPSYNSASGTDGIPIRIRRGSQETPSRKPRFRSARPSAPVLHRARSPAPLARIARSPPASASSACSQSSIEMPSHVRRLARPHAQSPAAPRAMHVLSASSARRKTQKDGARCSGGGSADACIVERRPLASAKYSVS